LVLRVARRVRVFPDLDAASAELADALARCAREAVAARGRFRWVISGGRTPLPLFARLAGRGAPAMPWKQTEVYFADERCVPARDPQSNFGSAWTTFLSKVPVRRRSVHRMRGELRPIGEGARRYARSIGRLPDLGQAATPRFDLVLLGIGPDGHTASLFPGQPAVAERRTPVVAVPSAGQPPYVPRLTLTPPALSNAGRVWFLVAGTDKRAALGRLFRAGDRADPRLPASLIRPPAPVEWFVDQEAARGLLSTSVTARRRAPSTA
jgi:6-phosphogluconolactonase